MRWKMRSRTRTRTRTRSCRELPFSWTISLLAAPAAAVRGSFRTRGGALELVFRAGFLFGMLAAVVALVPLVHAAVPLIRQPGERAHGNATPLLTVVALDPLQTLPLHCVLIRLLRSLTAAT